MKNPAARVSAYKQTFHSVIAMTLWTKGVIARSKATKQSQKERLLRDFVPRNDRENAVASYRESSS